MVFDLPGFTPEVGFEFSFPGGPRPDKQYIHLCEIIEVVPNKILKYSWTYEGHLGYTTVSFELFEEDKSTRVKLTHSSLESFSLDNKDLARKNFEEGWTHLIGISLKEYLTA